MPAEHVVLNLNLSEHLPVYPKKPPKYSTYIQPRHELADRMAGYDATVSEIRTDVQRRKHHVVFSTV